MIRRVLAHVRIFKSLAEHLRSKWNTKQTLCLRVTAFDHMVTVFTLTLLSQLSMYSVTSFGWFCLFCFKNLSILASDVLFISRLFYKLWYFKILINIRFSMYNALTVLSVIRNNNLRYPLWSLVIPVLYIKDFRLLFQKGSGSHLLSHAVSSIVPSAA